MSQKNPEIAQHLRLAGVRFVYLEYRGFNGRGEIQSILYLDVDGKSVSAPLSDLMQQRLQKFFLDLLSKRHPDWSLEAGSIGDFSWLLDGDILSHKHHSVRGNGESFDHEGL